MKIFIMLLCLFSQTYILASSIAVSNNGRFQIGVVNPMQDVNLGLWDGVSDVSVEVGHCVVATRNGNVRQFFMLNTSSEGETASQFLLSDGLGNTVGMTMERYWTTDGQFRALQPNNDPRINNGLTDCTGQGQGPHRFRITILAADLEGLPTGTYSTTITTRTRPRRNNPDPEVFDTFNVSITIPTEIQINNISDIAFGVYNGTGQLQVVNTFCVYVKDGATYGITFNDDSGNTGYLLTHSQLPSEQIPYVLDFTTAGGVTPVFNTIEGVEYNNWTGSPTQNCTDGFIAAIRVTITENDLQAATVAGSYQSILTLTVSPD